MDVRMTEGSIASLRHKDERTDMRTAAAEMRELADQEGALVA